MGGRRSSGLFEMFGTLVKSSFGFGTTVEHKKDWLGRTQKVVKHHGSNKKKTYTHGCGLFGNVTKTKTEKYGRTIEKGRLKKNFLWGATEKAQRTDGTKIERKYKPGLLKNHVITRVIGECWQCFGSGSITSGSARNKRAVCPRCHGSGQFSKTIHKSRYKWSGR